MERVDYESMVVQELLDAYNREELDIQPWYQRRAVWTNPHKSYLINSIFSGMPVPTVYIRHTIDLEREKTIKEVVDGQQRIRSILGFRNGEFAARHPSHPKRVSYSDLTPRERQHFLMTKLPVGYLVGADDRDVIEIFGRLNAVSKTLNAQEKRSARFSGEFHQFCLREAASRLALWRDWNLFTATEISRMTEVQFIAEISMALCAGLEDFSASRVDRAYQAWDEEFPEHTEVAERLERVFAFLASLEPTVVRDTILSRAPVFFSLFVVLDRLKRLPKSRDFEAIVWEIDGRFSDPKPLADKSADDAEFIAACTASTQRIRSRTVRDNYIAGFLAS